jgi:hypothetical protein
MRFLKIHQILPLAIGFAAIVGTSGLAAAGSPVYVGSKASQNLSIDKIDHSSWDGLLAKYVDGNGMVDYRSWKATTADAQVLDRYLNHLSTATAKAAASREAKLAFWINAYNAVTIRGILREYPTTSIRNHTAKFFGYNIWQDLKLYVGGSPYSLEDIEHETLRKMSEPRIHFAIVCASIGCPRLLNEAYVADRIDEQLTINAKDFFARRQNFRNNAAARGFQLSSILSWFDEDFGSNQKQMLKTISPWLPTPQAQAAARSGSVSVAYLTYDWKLNAQR